MPIYEYECQNCGKVFEIIWLSEKDEPDNCKICQGKLRRIVSQFLVSTAGKNILRNLPDPVPPLTELVGKGKNNKGFEDLPARTLNEYKRIKKDTGETVWIPKEKKYFHA